MSTNETPKSTKRIEMMPLSELLKMRHTGNPKEHSHEQIDASFERFGFTNPPMIDERSELLVAGHGRCETLQKRRAEGRPPPRGVEERGVEWYVPVLRGNSFADDKERDAYLMADNQQAAVGGWNLDKLLELLNAQDNFEGLGFDDAELQSFGVAEFVDDDDDADETKVSEHTRKKKSKDRKPGLTYKIVITCTDEGEQAKLIERLESEGLTCAPLIV